MLDDEAVSWRSAWPQPLCSTYNYVVHESQVDALAITSLSISRRQASRQMIKIVEWNIKRLKNVKQIKNIKNFFKSTLINFFYAKNACIWSTRLSVIISETKKLYRCIKKTRRNVLRNWEVVLWMIFEHKKTRITHVLQKQHWHWHTDTRPKCGWVFTTSVTRFTAEYYYKCTGWRIKSKQFHFVAYNV